MTRIILACCLIIVSLLLIACGGGPALVEHSPQAVEPNTESLEILRWEEIKRPLKVGAEAYLESKIGEQHVRLFKTKEFQQRWAVALAANDQSELLRIAGDLSSPIMSLNQGACIQVLELEPSTAKVQITHGLDAGLTVYCHPNELDPGIDRMPIYKEKQAQLTIEDLQVLQEPVDNEHTSPASDDGVGLPLIVDNRMLPSSGKVYVKGHYRNGVWVRPHYRSPPKVNFFGRVGRVSLPNVGRFLPLK